MKFIPKKSLLIASLLAVVGVSAQAQVIPYVIDGRGEVAMSGAGLCWRTGYWTPQLAAENPKYGCACDKDLMPADKCSAAAGPGAGPATPAGGPKPVAKKVTLSADALFDFDKAVLRPEGKTKLDDLASQAGKLNLEVIIAVGHTDRIGSDSYNQKLSERRAAAVKTYLVGKGIAANKVYTEGKGEKQPVTGDKCKKMGAESAKNKKLVECLQPDRRVDIEVIGTN
ncbi:MAG: OmpA family protein [Rhodocyclaceae bacterium]|nr:OmpA family protein [Rhodocyclaceae bacterium]